MAGIVRLKHITRKNNWRMYFYNGLAEVKNGVIELPADNFTRIRRAFLLGFRLTEDGQPILANRYDEIVAKATVKDSSEEQVSEQDSNSGGQSGPENGLREGESDSGGNSDEKQSSGRVRRRSGRRRQQPAADSGDSE